MVYEGFRVGEKEGRWAVGVGESALPLNVISGVDWNDEKMQGRAVGLKSGLGGPARIWLSGREGEGRID